MYWGSVRFFKHIILGILVLAILVPTGLCVYYGLRSAHAEQENTLMQLEISRQKTETVLNNSGLFQLMAATNQQETSSLFWTDNLDYQQLYPDLYCEKPSQTIYSEKEIYLTFDDGPSERTGEILDILKQYNIKATFFVVTNNHDTPEMRSMLQRIVREGHTIGVHSFSHNYALIYSSVDAYLKDFYKDYQWVYDVTGVYPTIFRFPGGSINEYNGGIYREIITEMSRRGFTYYDWNIAAGDASEKQIQVSTIEDTVISQAKSVMRGIVLMHDSSKKETTVQALPGIIQGLQKQGFSFEPLTNQVKPVHFIYKE